MAKQKNKAYALTREKYKVIKKYDHQQMEDFCAAVFESGVKAGYKAGCEAAAEAASGELTEKFRKIALEETLQAAARVKGIGDKKLEDIRRKIEEVQKNG